MIFCPYSLYVLPEYSHFPEARDVIRVISHEGMFSVIDVHVGIVVRVTADERDRVAVDATDIELPATDVGADESLVVRA